MTTNLDGRNGIDPLGEFPKEIRDHLQSMKEKVVPSSLVNRVKERALQLDNPEPNPRHSKSGNLKSTAPIWGLAYTSAVLAATAFLTLGLLQPWNGKDTKQTGIELGRLPRLSTVAQSPLPLWDKAVFEKDLMQTKDLMDLTAEKIQVQIVRDELIKVIEAYKR